MLDGIPFFGKEHNSIYAELIKSEATRLVHYNTMYEMIVSELPNNPVVVIDNTWCSWLKDAKFNYRDRAAYIPYYTYQLCDMTVAKNHSDNKGHLLLDTATSTLSLRHTYKLEKLDLDIKQELTLFNVETREKYSVVVANWYEPTFDEYDLYIKYLSSAYYDFDDLLEKHQGGYHYINRQFKGFNNLEWQKRKQFGLPHFAEDNLKLYDFRDVRQYRKEELFGNTVRETIIPYKIRRLQFDCLLYCIIKQESVPHDVDLAKRYAKLKSQPCILSYRPYYGAPPLIYKSYWYGAGSFEDKHKIRQHV